MMLDTHFKRFGWIGFAVLNIYAHVILIKHSVDHKSFMTLYALLFVLFSVQVTLRRAPCPIHNMGYPWFILSALFCDAFLAFGHPTILSVGIVASVASILIWSMSILKTSAQLIIQEDARA